MQQPNAAPALPEEPASPPRAASYSITDDPIFYGTVIMFALLTTIMPAILGQPRFLPVVQTLALTTFLALTVRRHKMRQIVTVLLLWLLIQFTLITLLSWATPGSLERAIPSGFDRRTAFIAWLFGNGALPDSLLARPIGRIGELFLIGLGGALTGGLLAVWILVRSVNLAGFYAGSLLVDFPTPLAMLIGLPLWTLLRLAGYAGWAVLAAEPMLIKNWSPGHLLQRHRRLLLISSACVALGLILELTLPGLWKALAAALLRV
ncbi:MAG: hypothetical protein R3A44_42700 [Caldilineaceae bacterium]